MLSWGSQSSHRREEAGEWIWRIGTEAAEKGLGVHVGFSAYKDTNGGSSLS